MKAKVTQRVGLVHRALVQIRVSDDGTSSVLSILLALHQQRERRKDYGTLGSYKTFSNPMTRIINSNLACF